MNHLVEAIHLQIKKAAAPLRNEPAKPLLAPDTKKLILVSCQPRGEQRLEKLVESELPFWLQLKEAFPAELQPLDKNTALHFLKRRNMQLYNINTPNLLSAIQQSAVREILFIDSLGATSTFSLFYEGMLGESITSIVRLQRGLVLNKSFFDRPIILTVLYSASANANLGIARSPRFKAERPLLDEDHPIHDFRIKLLQEKFEWLPL